MGTRSRRIRIGAALSALAGATILPLGTAEAAPPPPIRCGAVITQSTTLATDIGPCAKGGLVVGANNITLDLGGHRVFGKDNKTKDGIGIRVAGRTGVTVRNGVVTFFDAGVSIEGGSGNTVTGLLVNRNVSDGSTDFGDGIALSTTAGNTIIGNNVTYNGPFDGIGIFGASTGNLLEDNFVGNNSEGFTGEDGIRVEGPGAANNTVRGNTVVGNTLDGIAIFGTGGNINNTIEDNTVTGNGFGHLGARPGDGIRLFIRGNSNIVRNNQVHDNAGNGIIVGSQSNQILSNNSTGNGLEPGVAAVFDLLDTNTAPVCDNNTWSGNVFGTANPACTTL